VGERHSEIAKSKESGIMKYNIEYKTLCSKGLLRKINQDNFWCIGEFLESKNDGLTSPIIGVTDSKSTPAFAVFDGMGGEQQGEIAAYIAAECFDFVYNKGFKSDIGQFLDTVCREMNGAICKHIKEQHLSSCGTTAAILMFGKTDVYICNIGDSRIYRFSENKLTQISCDHNESDIFSRKPSLTQYLGIPETEFVIEPFITKAPYKNGDKYLICSDGLTDMVTEEEIIKTMAEAANQSDCAEELLNKALEAGGYDNITLIVCELRKNSIYN